MERVRSTTADQEEILNFINKILLSFVAQTLVVPNRIILLYFLFFSTFFPVRKKEKKRRSFHREGDAQLAP